MPKEVPKSSEHLVKLMLDKEIKRDKTKFADIDIKDLKNSTKTRRMLNDLQLRTAEVDYLKKEGKIHE